PGDWAVCPTSTTTRNWARSQLAAADRFAGAAASAAAIQVVTSRIDRPVASKASPARCTSIMVKALIELPQTNLPRVTGRTRNAIRDHPPANGRFLDGYRKPPAYGGDLSKNTCAGGSDPHVEKAYTVPMALSKGVPHDP